GNSNNGTGTLNVKDNGTFTTDGDFNISDVGTSTGIINLSGTGTITSTGQTFVGKNGAEAGGTTGTINQTGGTFNCSNWISVGRFRYSTGTVNVSGGAFNQTSNDQGLIIGEEGAGTLNVTGGGVNITGNPGLLVTNNATSVGTVNLDGGTITTKRVQAGAGGAGTANFNFDGGTLTAGTGANADFFTGMDTAVFEDGGGTINSNGNTIAINQTLTGIGGLTKSGAGTLLINGSAEYTGTTVVSAGTLGGIGNIAGNVTVNSGASINPGAPLGVLTATGTTTFSAGASLTIDLDASPDMLAAVNLVLNNTTLVLNGTPTQPVYLLARYGSRSGTFATAAPAGYAYDYNYISEGFSHIALVQTGGGSPYATWINTFFPGETNPAIIGETADPDKDGSSNALEFALGGAPNSGSNNAKVYSLQADGSVDPDTNKELLLTIAVRTGTPAFSPATGGSPTATHEGFTYTVQGSLNLSGFATGVTVVAPVPPASNPTAPTGYEYRTFSLDGSNNLTGKGFLRARVTKVP
ncbi:MAG: hypothetical protein EOP84_03225, partial [Verrucomicrobiaceae bacterium]